MDPKLKKTHKVLTEKQFKEKYKIRKYGTSEGAMRAWDTRGRGQKEEPKGDRTRGHMRAMAGEEKVSTVAEDTGVSKERATQIIEAVDRYSSSDYGIIRGVQSGKLDASRYGEKGAEYQSLGNALEELIGKSPKFDGEIYRGTKFGKERYGQPTTGTRPDIKVGDVIDMKGTSSWSSSKEVARKFGDILFHSTKAGKGTSIQHLAFQGASEKEVLVSKEQKYRVVKVTNHSSGTNIEVEPTDG